MSGRPDSDAGRVFIGYARVSTRGQDLDQENKPVAEVARLLGVHRATLYRALDGA